MAWNEVLSQRNQRSRTYQDTLDPDKRAWSDTLAALHYEDPLDSSTSIYDRFPVNDLIG